MRCCCDVNMRYGTSAQMLCIQLRPLRDLQVPRVTEPCAETTWRVPCTTKVHWNRQGRVCTCCASNPEWLPPHCAYTSCMSPLPQLSMNRSKTTHVARSKARNLACMLLCSQLSNTVHLAVLPHLGATPTTHNSQQRCWPSHAGANAVGTTQKRHMTIIPRPKPAETLCCGNHAQHSGHQHSVNTNTTWGAACSARRRASHPAMTTAPAHTMPPALNRLAICPLNPQHATGACTAGG